MRESSSSVLRERPESCMRLQHVALGWLDLPGSLLGIEMNVRTRQNEGGFLAFLPASTSPSCSQSRT